MFINKREQGALQILTFTEGLYSACQRDDIKELERWEREGANKKKLKQLKELIANRAKILQKLKTVETSLYRRLPNTKPARKFLRDLDKKSSKLIKKKMEQFNRVFKRTVYVELDYVAGRFVEYLNKSKILPIEVSDVKLAQKLLESPLTQYKDMSKEDREAIDKFIRNLFLTTTELREI